MKRLLIFILLMASAQQAYSMKRAVRFPMTAAKKTFTKLFTSGNYSEALTIAKTSKDVSNKVLLRSDETTILGQQLEADLYKTNEKLTNDMLSPLRDNWYWMLPTSIGLMASVQDPLLLGIGFTGLTLGSLGLKKECDYFVNKFKYKSLVKNAEEFNELFCKKLNKKEKELKTK